MLTTKEFIEKVESTGYKTEIGHRRIYIYKDEEAFDREIPCASIDPEEQFGMICNGRLSSSEVFDYLTEYAQTPIDKREKKGYLWIKNVGQNGESINTISHVLVYEEHKNIVFFATKNTANNLNLQTEYTKSEKEEIERKTGVPLCWIDEE